MYTVEFKEKFFFTFFIVNSNLSTMAFNICRIPTNQTIGIVMYDLKIHQIKLLTNTRLSCYEKDIIDGYLMDIQPENWLESAFMAISDQYHEEPSLCVRDALKIARNFPFPMKMQTGFEYVECKTPKDAVTNWYSDPLHNPEVKTFDNKIDLIEEIKRYI